MAKRFATMFFIMIGVVVFLLSAFLLVLFLAPGARIFGLKYITVGTHAVDTGKVSISSKLQSQYGSSTFSKSVIINSSEVPVIIEFASAGTDYYYHYYDNYSGITKSEITDPAISLEKNDNGDAVITVNSFESYIFQNSNSTRWLRVYIPLANIAVTERPGQAFSNYGSSDPGASGKYTTNLTINSVNAEVHFANADKTRAPAFNTVAIKTTGNIVHNGTHVKALNFKYETDKSINVSSSTSTIVNAKNYELISTGGNIYVTRKLTGDLSAQTKNGNIEFESCNNFSGVTELGDIKCSFGGRTIIVAGTANIKTSAGSVKIEEILGAGLSKIETGSGSVELGKILNASINTHRGSVSIKSVKDASIISNMGNVTIEEVLEKITVSTKRGKVRLGGEGMTLMSPTVSSHLGEVVVTEASGAVSIETISSDVTFSNKNSTKIDISAGGKLDATNLKGSVSINAAETAYLEFASITSDVNILLEDSCSYVKIDALNTDRTRLHYSMSGNPVSIYEANNTGYATFSLIEAKQHCVNENLAAVKFQVVGDNATGSVNAKVDVYFDKSQI